MLLMQKAQLRLPVRQTSARQGFSFALVVLCSCAALLTAGLGLARADDKRDGPALRIMTQNMDQGTEFNAVVTAPPQAFLAAVAAAIHDILATKPSERAAAIAKEIAQAKPDFVALQEAAILKTGATPATLTVQMDLLASLLAELEKLGEHYNVVAIVPGVDAEASGSGFAAEIMVRDAIIARTNPGGQGPIFLNVEVQNFQANVTFPTPIGPITDKRGWAVVDAMVRGRAFRLVTTHLDADVPAVQLAQAEELIAKTGDTLLPTIFAGDFNANASNPVDSTHLIYQKLIDAGFIDAWTEERGSDPGFTCCQDPNLLNAQSKLDKRIDLVLLRGAVDVQDIGLVGANPVDRTPSGLWPSDHAGVAAILDVVPRGRSLVGD
jgi:endonuclease/exonuclease/phosphatase family metal-dependent hydrolase